MDCVDVIRAIEAVILERAAIARDKESELFDGGQWGLAREAGRAKAFDEAAEMLRDVADGLERKEADEVMIRRIGGGHHAD